MKFCSKENTKIYISKINGCFSKSKKTFKIFDDNKERIGELYEEIQALINKFNDVEETKSN
jgi:hypothetical protein